MENNDRTLDDLIGKKVEEVMESNNHEDEKSPLEKMKEANEKSGGRGVVINNDEYTEDKGKQFDLRSPADDRRDEDFKNYLEDQDKLIETAKKVEVVRKPQNQIEMMAMITELDNIATNGEAIQQPRDKDGNIIDMSKVDDTKGSTLITGSSNGTFIREKSDTNESNQIETSTEEKSDSTDKEQSEKDKTKLEKLKKETEEKNELVTVLIDKTGISVENGFDFTEDEKSHIKHAREIVLKQVETVDLKSYTVVKPAMSFAEAVSANQPGIGNTIVTCVSSGYRATVKGASYYQLGDLIINPQTASFDKYHKVYSVIYNSIVNTTVGKFETFEDFLKNTTWIDMNVLLYGIIVSTFPEVDTLNLTCQNCKHQFEHKYVVSQLFDLKNTTLAYLNGFKKLVDAPASEHRKMFENAPVHKTRQIKLPYSGWVIECGISSAYDYLYKKVRNAGSEEEWKQSHPDDVNGIMYANAEFVPVIKGVGVPVPNTNKVTMYEGFDDIINAIYMLPTDDLPVLNNILTKYYNDYDITFSIKNTKCPNCGNTTDVDAISLYDLVFLKLQLLASTEINTEDLPQL